MRQVSLVFQNGGWYDHLSVKQHFELDGLCKSDLERSLAELDLSDVRHSLPAELSGGQAQRLAIGRALSRKQPLLLLDEPLSQLDQPIRDSLRRLLHAFHQQDRTFIYVTHDQNDAMLMATRIAVLHAGKIQQIGTPKELFENPNHRCVAEMIGQPAMPFFNVKLSPHEQSNLRESLRSPELSATQETVNAIHRGILTAADRRDLDCAVQVGVRPNAWRITERNVPNDDCRTEPCLSFEVMLVEERFMEHYRLLQFMVAGASAWVIQVIANLHCPPLNLMTGSNYTISVPSRHLYWFDAGTGHRLDKDG